MSSNELQDYVELLRKKNIDDDEIGYQLKVAGWADKEISEALHGKSTSDSLPPPPPPPGKGNSNVVSGMLSGSSMWDAFEHILMFISLYVMSGSIALILHFFVDKWVKKIDPYATSYSSYTQNWELTMFRGYMAALIVSYPLFAFLFLHITKRTLANPVIRQLKARRFLIYFTLVITFLIMVGNIIGFIFSFLNGDVAFNFILHILVTLIVCGILFGYYFMQIQEDRKSYA